MHPRLVQFGHLVLPTYGVLVALGAIVSLLLYLRLARLLTLDSNKTWNLALLGLAVAFAGSKLLAVAWYWPRYGARAFAVNLMSVRGAFAGATALAVAACVLYAVRVGLPLRRSADAVAPALALGSSIASIGCFEAGCDYGAPTHLPWAVVFTSPFTAPDTPLGVPLHPTQLYAGAIDFVFFVLLLWLLYRPHSDGEVMGAWLFLSGLTGFFLGFVRGDNGPILSGGFSLAQWTAASMVVAGGLLWLRRDEVREISHAR